ncbi:hypothetical protein GQ457_05G027200 [Hibiscus cannabinus]
MIDLPLKMKKFTWFENNYKGSRLDRFLLDDEWLIRFQDIVQYGLKRSFSDHTPIILSSGDNDWGPRLF